MQTTVLSRTWTGEALEIVYTSPVEIPLFPSSSPAADDIRVTLRRAWYENDFATLHGLWLRAGGPDCDGGLLYEITIPGGWFAEMRPNPAEIMIIEAAYVGKTPVSRKAWGNELHAQALMIDLLLCHETKEPIFQRLVSFRSGYFQLILPAKGRCYGLRKAIGAAPGRVDARRAVEA